MMSRCKAVQIAVAMLIFSFAYPDEILKVKNADEAMRSSLVYLRGRTSGNLPAGDAQWQEKTIFSDGPVDLVITSKQFTSDDWIIEVSQGLAPLRNIVYQVTVFSSKEGWYWKGSIKADGTIKEETPFTQLSVDEKQKIAEELLKKGKIRAPSGGYGH